MQSGKVAHRQMREVNRSLLLELLREGGQISRVELARRTALSKPTVSAIIEELIGDGLAVEVGLGTPQARGGRPPSLLAYNEAAETYAGVQFGVHSTYIALADGRGNVIGRRRGNARHGDAQGGIADAAAMIAELLHDRGIPVSRVRAVGAAVPGLVDHETGRCAIAPNLEWHDVPVQEWLGDAVGTPAIALNSTVMAARAEGHTGAAVATSSYVWVYAGTGIGAGLVHDGKVLLGSRGFAGEIGHCPVVETGPLCSCGNRGCLETVASANAIERAAAAAVAAGEATSLRGGADAVAVAAAAADGDAVAQRLMGEAAHHLGRGIAYLSNILNPALVVIGGPLAQAGDAYIGAVAEAVEQHTLGAVAPPVVVTALGTDAPLLGALQMAAEWYSPAFRLVGARPA